MGYRRAFNNDIPLMLLKAPTNTEMSIVSLKKLLSVKQQLYYSCIIELIIKGFFFQKKKNPPPTSFPKSGS